MMTNFFNREQTTVLRGIAALMIVVLHVAIAWECHRVVNLPGSVFISAFIVMSGYGLNESYKRVGLEGYWRRRMRRIVVPWWAYLCVLYLIKGFPGWKAAVLEAVFIDTDYWFMTFIMWSYLTYWASRKLFKKSWMMVLVVFGFVSLNMMEQMAAEQSFSFLAGVWLSEHITEVRSWPLRRALKIALVSMCIGLFFVALKEIPAVHALKYTLAYHYILLMIKLPLAVPMLLLPLLIPALCKSRLLWLSGIASLEIYLVHLPMMFWTAHSWPRLGIFVVLTVVLSWAYYQVNNRVIPRLL